MSEAKIANYAEDEIVLEQGDASKCLYKVLSGSVGLFLNYGREDEYLVGAVSAPHCFGEMTILMGKPNPYTVVALKESVLMRVPESNFEHFIQDNHQNAIMIMKTMARNLAMVNMNMNLLIDELKEIGKAENVDKDAIKRLAAEYGGEREIAHEPEIPEQENVPEKTSGGLFLPGHKGCPGVTYPEYKKGVYQKQYTCPHCGKVFQGWRIFTSKLVPRPEATWLVRYDGRRFYQEFEPYWYDVVTCPECCFSANSDYFLESGVLFKQRYAGQLKEAAEALKLNFEAERDLDFVYAQHYLALICAQGLVLSQRRRSVAKLWKNLCWMYEDANEREMERQAAARAAQALVEVLDIQERNHPRQPKMFIEIAAMFEKGGEREKAREWVLKAREKQSGGVYGGMAQRLLENVSENVREE